MKTTNLMFLLMGTTTVGAFAVAPLGRVTHKMESAALKSEKSNTDKDEGSLDLDLEEMFTMFDAAAKEENFDDALKKVKKESS
jgi:hypothetical protein